MTRLTGLILTLAFTTLVAAQTTNLDLATVTTDTLHHMADDAIVEASWSKLTRTDDSVAMELHTNGLEPGAVYTVWWVVFNNPDACSAAVDGDPAVAVCGADDVNNADGDLDPTMLARISTVWATGGVADANGEISLSAVLSEGEAPGELRFGPMMLEDARSAEVHLVLRSHSQPDMDRLASQLTTFEDSGCEACVNAQYTIFMPVD